MVLVLSYNPIEKLTYLRIYCVRTNCYIVPIGLELWSSSYTHLMQTIKHPLTPVLHARNIRERERGMNLTVRFGRVEKTSPDCHLKVTSSTSQRAVHQTMRVPFYLNYYRQQTLLTPPLAFTPVSSSQKIPTFCSVPVPRFSL